MPLPKSNAPCRKWTAVMSEPAQSVELNARMSYWHDAWRNQLRYAESNCSYADSHCKKVYINTHLVSEICQDNKKLVNIFCSVGHIIDRGHSISAGSSALSKLNARCRSYDPSLTVMHYTFSHCESAPSQLNAAWGNSFRQLHPNFDNPLALRQISLE